MVNMITKSFVLLLCFIAGCNQMRGHPDRYVKREVKTDEIVGVWNITEDSCRNLRNKGYKLYVKPSDHNLEFRDDGTCSVKTYPPLKSHPSKNEQVGGFIMNEEGTWELANIKGLVGHKILDVRGVQIKIKVGENSISTRTLKFYIAEEDGRLVLWTHIGDPDYVNYQDFMKGTK